MAVIELTIDCRLVEDAFKFVNDLDGDVKITGAEFDEWEDKIYLSVMVESDDLSKVPVGSSILEHDIALELSEDLG